jgi:uncharacterized protein (TIGR02246 family)
MKHQRLFCMVFLASAYLYASPTLVIAQPATETATEADAPPADEAAIRASIGSYVDAFNQGDAQALAAHWGEQGEYISPSGEELRGRQTLTERFKSYFADTTGARLELIDTTVQLLSPSVAVESGWARIILPSDEPIETKYEAIHVRGADGWKIDSLREAEPPAPPPSHYDQLQSLEPLIGRWVSGDEVAGVETNCRWTTNRNYLVWSFRVHSEEGVEFEGTQVIGWDPARQVIRSWMFDSDGGFSVGRWTGDEGRWTVNTLNVLPDGRQGSAKHIFELVDSDTLRFRSIGRQVEGELLPSIESVNMVRQPE